MHEALDAPALYEREIHQLAARPYARAFTLEPALSPARLAIDAPKLSKLLAREVSAGTYRFAPLRAHTALIEGKARTLYRADALDAVVFSAVARVMQAAVEPRLGEHLHSYRKGRSQWTAARALLGYLRKHASERADPRTRGLFVLRRDVKSYGEQIPVGDDSSLWTTLTSLVGAETFGVRGDFLGFLKRSLRPEVVVGDGAPQVLERGVPTGLPAQPVACNAYLLPLDAELCAIPGALYARFGDDLVFAHPDLARAREVSTRIDARLQAVGLQLNPDKSKAFWLTHPGRGRDDALEFTPASHVPYLGLDIGFVGARLRKDKRRALWLSLRARLAHADALLGPTSPAERADALCEVIRTALDLRSPVSEHYAPWLRFELMSTADLRQLDHHIALAVAERVARRRGVRAFRTCSPQQLYAQHGLPSLMRVFVEARRRGRSER
jgi:hypothetical protein